MTSHLEALRFTVVMWLLGCLSGVALAAIIGHLSDARMTKVCENNAGGLR